MSGTVRRDFRDDTVTWRMSRYDAHDLGRYLFEIGSASHDESWRDGARLLREVHDGDRCDLERDCALFGVEP